MCQDLLSLRREEKCIILICLTSMFEIMLVPLENTIRKGCKHNYQRKILLWIRKKWLGSSHHVPSLHTIVNKTHFLLGQRGRGVTGTETHIKERTKWGETSCEGYLLKSTSKNLCWNSEHSCWLFGNKASQPASSVHSPRGLTQANCWPSHLPDK